MVAILGLLIVLLLAQCLEPPALHVAHTLTTLAFLATRPGSFGALAFSCSKVNVRFVLFPKPDFSTIETSILPALQAGPPMRVYDASEMDSMLVVTPVPTFTTTLPPGRRALLFPEPPDPPRAPRLLCALLCPPVRLGGEIPPSEASEALCGPSRGSCGASMAGICSRAAARRPYRAFSSTSEPVNRAVVDHQKLASLFGAQDVC
jgi:hypothetical protein